MKPPGKIFAKLAPVHPPARRTLPIALILVAGTALSIAAFFLVHSLEIQERTSAFEQIAIERVAALEQSIHVAAVDGIHAIGGLFAASETVTRNEFKRFLSRLHIPSGSVQAFEWIPRVPESSRAAYEKAAQAWGYPDFRFMERGEEGRMTRAGTRDEYFPVYYVAPLQGNESALGFDLGSETTRLNALRKARDTGDLVASERITLVQEKQGQFGFLVFLPVYDSNEVPATVALRRKTLTGYALGVFRIASMVKSSLPGPEAAGLAVEIYIYDASAPPGRQLLYPKNASAQSVEELTLPVSLGKTIRVADRDWRVVIAPARGVLTDAFLWESLTALAAGLLITALLMGYLVLGLMQRVRLEEIEASLRKNRNMMLKAQEVAHFGYIEWDLKSGKQAWSDEVFRIIGRKPQEVEPNEKFFADMIHPEDKKFVLSTVARVVEQSEVLESEFRIVTPDGLTRHIRGQAERLMDSAGKPSLIVSTLQDITERKLAELRTETVLDDLARLIDTANAPIFGIDTQGRVNEWNQTTERITGFTKKEMVGRNLVEEIVTEDYKAAVKNVLVMALKGVESANYEFRLLTKSGERVDVLLNSTTRRDSTGDIVGVVGIGQDITERKKSENDLRESEQRFRDFAESAADWFWEMDEDLRFTYMSPNVERILDVKPEWHYGKTRQESLGENYDREVWSRHLDDLKHRRPFKDFTYLRVGEGIAPAWISTSGIPIFDADGHFKGYRGSGSDITGKKMAEEERNKLISIIENSGDLMGLADPTGQCLFLNKAGQNLVGLANEKEVITKSMSDFFSQDDLEFFKSGILPVVMSQGDWKGEFRFRHFQTGELIPIEMNLFTIEDAVTGQTIALATVSRDITERKHAQAQVIQASKLATLGEMATSVAHELNQPLNVISMAAGNLVRRQKKGTITPEYLHEKLTRITSQTERAAAIIDHMRMFGRKSGEKPSPLDPRETIQGAFDLMGEQLRLAGIQVEMHLPESCPDVLGHRVQMEQVFLNLLANSRDAIQSNSGEHPKKISLSVQCSEENRVTISIRDTGGGIPESVFTRLFEPFFTTKEVGKGTGLGLSVSYGIIRDMGGTIEAENVEAGAQFTISLPVLSPSSSTS